MGSLKCIKMILIQYLNKWLIKFTFAWQIQQSPASYFICNFLIRNNLDPNRDQSGRIKKTHSIDKLRTSELGYLFWATKRLTFLEQSHTIWRSDPSIAKDTSTNTTQMWAWLYWPCGCVLNCNSRITREELATRYSRVYLARQLYWNQKEMDEWKRMKEEI